MPPRPENRQSRDGLSCTAAPFGQAAQARAWAPYRAVLIRGHRQAWCTFEPLARVSKENSGGFRHPARRPKARVCGPFVLRASP
jgi:hypothetical protein